MGMQQALRGFGLPGLGRDGVIGGPPQSGAVPLLSQQRTPIMPSPNANVSTTEISSSIPSPAPSYGSSSHSSFPPKAMAGVTSAPLGAVRSAIRATVGGFGT